MTTMVTYEHIQFEFKLKIPPRIGQTIFIGTKPHVVLSLDLGAKTGCARPFTQEDNLRDPVIPVVASRKHSS